MKSKTITIALAIFVAVVGLYAALTEVGIRKHEKRLERTSQFLSIGRQVLTNLNNEGNEPETVSEQSLRKWLSEPQLGFLRSNNVELIPSKSISSEEPFMRMPYENGRDLVLLRSGFLIETNGAAVP